MLLVKLDATDSTNEYLKEWSREEALANYTIVTATFQKQGKGQMGSKWESERGKNLIMSIFITDFMDELRTSYNLNIAVSVAVIDVLETYSIPQLAIKWPNDIMAGDKKIGGILIENLLKREGRIVSIAGIGLNVNQTDFVNLPNASSLAALINTVYDVDKLALEIAGSIRSNAERQDKSAGLWNKYKQLLFKKGIQTTFKDGFGNHFLGTIHDVSPDGKLQVLLENGSARAFDLKEIRMIY